jgi:hypothetical protein
VGVESFIGVIVVGRDGGYTQVSPSLALSQSLSESETVNNKSESPTEDALAACLSCPST